MTSLIAQYGALGVFALMVPESACIPIPSELTLLFSGYAVDRGWIAFPLAVAAATAGNLVGSLLAYGLGASGLPERVPGLRGVLARWESMLDRRGTRAVLIARLLPLARSFVSLPAGARRIPLVRFIVLTAIGCALWATAFTVAGMLAGSAWQTLDSIAGRVLLGVGLVVVAVSCKRASKSRGTN
jgi:membrane protein DedA with SNARE-associated domain